MKANEIIFCVLEQKRDVCQGGLGWKNTKIFSFCNAFLVFPADYKIGVFQRPLGCTVTLQDDSVQVTFATKGGGACFYGNSQRFPLPLKSRWLHFAPFPTVFQRTEQRKKNFISKRSVQRFQLFNVNSLFRSFRLLSPIHGAHWRRTTQYQCRKPIRICGKSTFGFRLLLGTETRRFRPLSQF